MKYYPFILLVLALAVLQSCHTQNVFVKEARTEKGVLSPEDSLIYFNDTYEYTIRVDDKISISVWGHDELSVGSTYGIYNSNEVYGKWLMVDREGTIEVPRFGMMEVQGLTIPELKNNLKDSLAQILKNPVVDVKVLNREISLIGEFRDPATVAVDKGKNYLLDMIAQVGGFDQYANLKCIKVFRQAGEDTHILTIDLTTRGNYNFKNIPLYPGDIVIAPSRSYKEFDRRISVIIPFTSALTSAAIFKSAF
ncbi:polysaccharide biosynthesis/export family protein [Neolewinella aurantiaca]|nr:polysaccharide biosynthesis/export family protein [Neolewinella aurantiaca]